MARVRENLEFPGTWLSQKFGHSFPSRIDEAINNNGGHTTY